MGDTVELELPLQTQIVTADPRIEAARGKIAIRRGPLVYNVETADQPRIDGTWGSVWNGGSVTTQWRPDLLGGVMAITGQWDDGTPLTAIPNYARMNRAGPPSEYPPDHQRSPILSQVWIKT
jgi:DUF1680 family protein